MNGNVAVCLFAILTCLSVFVSARPTKKPCGYGTAEYVLIIGIDGLGGHQLRKATGKIPGLRSFFNQGSYTTNARSHNPTLSGPNWGTIVTGMRPEETGINNNYWKPANGIEDEELSQNYVEPVSGPGVPETMFNAAKKQNSKIKTSMSFSWDWFVYMSTSDVDHVFRGGWEVEPDTNWTGPLICSENMTSMQCGRITDQRAFNDTIRTIKSVDANLMFFYVGSVDQVGHDILFGGPEYYDALDVVDIYVQKIFESLSETKTPSGELMIDKTLVIITADHGGYNHSHSFCQSLTNIKGDANSTVCASYNTPAVTKIPVLLRGPGIKKKFDMKETFLTNRDLAPTALNALGLNKGEYMTGRVIEEAYETAYCAAENGAKIQKPRQISVLIAILYVAHNWLPFGSFAF